MEPLTERGRRTSWTLTTEPVMFLYMCSSSMKMPIFNELLYQKSCYGRYGLNASDICNNISVVHADKNLQDDVNRIFLLSSLFLLVPSVFMTLILGSLSDVWSIKWSTLIPFFGLVISNVNYIIQSYFVEWNVYWLLLSDIAYGVVGGFPATIGVLFAYSVKVSANERRSKKVAIMEGSMGFGMTLGSILSGQLRKVVGFAAVFSIIELLLVFATLYVVFFIKDLKPPESAGETESLSESVRRRIREIGEVYSSPTRDKYAQKFLNLVLLALIIEFICFAGSSDIMFSYLRYRFKWTDVENGIFNGVSTGLSSFAVILLYPIFHQTFRQSNALLAFYGLVTKIANLIMLAIVAVGWLAMGSIGLLIFSRFISTGLRSMASFYVDNEEQGKIFSLIALIQGLSFLVASPIYNGIYPRTLDIFPGTMLVASAIALCIPALLLVYIERSPEEKRLRGLAQQNNNSEKYGTNGNESSTVTD